MAIIESSLFNFAEFIISLADLTDHDENLAMHSTTLSMPVEIEVINNEDGSLVINSAPPTQQIETTFMPVLHQMKVKVIAKNGRNKQK